MESATQSSAQSATQSAQRQFTQLRTWLHGNDDTLQRLLSQIQVAHPEKDTTWCIDRLWTEQQSWRC
jgi:hypothetical protein